MPAPTAQTLASGEGGPGERENPAVELEEEVTVRCEPLRRGREQAAVGAEAVARREHCAGRLPGQLWPHRRQCNWKVGQVRDHEVELAGDGVEQVAVLDEDPVLEPVEADVRPRPGV